MSFGHKAEAGVGTLNFVLRKHRNS